MDNPQPAKKPRRTRRSVRRLVTKLLFAFVAFLMGLLLGEAGLRITGYGLLTPSAYQPDPYCGARHVPGFRGWHTREGRVFIEINNHGFRDRERSLQKPPGTFRIAVLGDSYSEAFQVELQQTFWSVMERKINQRRKPDESRVEVLNFGVSGYGTAQELEMLTHYVWDYQPDLVLLQFLAANDVANNSRKLEPDTGRPFYKLENDRLVLDNSFLQDPERVRFQTSTWIKLKDFVVQNTRLGALIYQVRHPPPEESRPKAGMEGMEPGLTMRAFCQPEDPDWQEAWAVTDQLILEIARQTQSRGARFVVLMANTGLEVEPDDELRERRMNQLEVQDLLYPQRRLSALGRKHGFTVLGLAQEMRQYAKRHQVYLHGFPNTQMGTGHWNKTGHRVAGELAADRLLELEMISTDAAPLSD